MSNLNISMSDFIRENPEAEKLLGCHLCLKIMFKLYNTPMSCKDIAREFSMELNDVVSLMNILNKFNYVSKIISYEDNVYILSQKGRLFIDLVKKEYPKYLL
jgi:predicted transcriptional regulator